MDRVEMAASETALRYASLALGTQGWRVPNSQRPSSYQKKKKYPPGETPCGIPNERECISHEASKESTLFPRLRWGKVATLRWQLTKAGGRVFRFSVVKGFEQHLSRLGRAPQRCPTLRPGKASIAHPPSLNNHKAENPKAVRRRIRLSDNKLFLTGR